MTTHLESKVLVIAVFFAFIAVGSMGALSTTPARVAASIGLLQLSSSFNFKDVTVSSGDVVSSSSVDPATYCGDTTGAQTASNSCKRVVVKTLNAAATLLSVATKVTTPFAISGTNTDIRVAKIVVEDNASNQLSSGTVGGGTSSSDQPSLNAADFYNAPGNSLEYGFYDESNQAFIIYYVYGRNSDTGQTVSLSSLTAGSMHVYAAYADGSVSD